MTSKHVILIDDDRASRRGLATYLSEVGEFKVSEYESGVEALDYLATTEEKHTAVLLDYVLKPPCSGEQVLQAIREKYPRLSVIVFTGRDRTGGVQALEKGAYRYLSRPLDPVEVVNILRNLAEQDMIFYEMARDVRKMLDFDLVLAWRLDKRAGLFRVVAWDGEPELDEAYRQTALLNPEDPTFRQFLEQGQPIYLTDVTDPQKVPRYAYREEAKKRGWTSLISVPLIHQNRIIGLLDSYTRKPFHFSNQEHKRFVMAALSAFANQAAEAVRNAGLYNQLEALQGINQILAGTFEEKTIIRQILSKGLELVGSDLGWLYLVDINSGNLILKDCLGISKDLVEHERELGEGITGWVAKKGQALNIADVSEENRHRPTRTVKVKSEVAVPLRREGQTIGVLTAKSRFPNAFTDDDVNLLMSLATQAAIVIGRTKLTKHLREVSSLALAGNYKDLINYVVEAVHDLTGADVNLWMISDQVERGDQFLQIVADRGNFAQSYVWTAKVPVAAGSSITGLALELGQPVVRRDILDDSEEPKFYHLEEAKLQDWHSFMTIPLIGGEGERLGSLSLYSQEIAKFGDPEVELMRTFANHVANVILGARLNERVQKLAIHNTRLLEQERTLRQQAETLREISGVISSDLELKEVAGRILDELCKVIDYRRASMQLIRGDIRTLVASRGFEAAMDDWLLRPVSQDRLVNRIVESKKPLILKQPSEDPDWEILPQTADVKSWIGLPLIYGEEAIGLLTLDHDQPGYYNEATNELLALFGSQAAIAIENARLFNDAQRRIRDLEIVNEVVQIINAKLDTQDLLETIVYKIAGTLDCTHCTFFFLQDEHGERLLVPRLTYGLYSDQVMRRRFRPGQGLVGWVFQHGEAIRLDNAKEDPRFSPVILEQYEARSMLVVPVCVGEETIGVISADQDKFGWFSEDDLHLVNMLARQAGTAVERVTTLELLQNIGNQIISHQNVDKILQQVVSGAIKLTNTTNGIIYLISEDGQSVVKSFQHPLDSYHPKPRMDKEGGITRRAIKAGQAMIFPDLRQDPSVNPDLYEQFQSMIAVPLKRQQRVVGVLYLNDVNRHHFTETEVSVLSTLAGQAAIAIENTRLLNNVQRRIRDLEIVSNITQIISTKLHTEDLLQEIVSQIANRLNCTHCTIFFPQEEDGEILLVPQVSHDDYAHKVTRRFKPGEGVAGWVFQQGRSLVLADVTQDSRFVLATTDQGVPRSMLVVPVQVGDQTIGVICADQDTSGWFSENDQRLVEALARHAGIAIERARGLDLLQDIGNQIISNQTVDEILQQIVSGAIKLTNTASGVIHLISEDSMSVVKSFQFPLNSDLPEPRINQKKGLTRLVLLDREPLIISDIRQDDRVNPALHDRFRSLIVIPLEFEQNVIGVLLLCDTKLHNFTETEVSLLSTLASQAAIAIQNARLFEWIQAQREAQTKAVGEIATSIAASKKLREVLDSILDWTVSLLGEASFGEVMLLDDKSDELVVETYRGETIEEKYVYRIPVGQGITGWVAQHGESLIVSDVRNEARYLPGLKSARSELAVPMLKDGKLIGVINVEHPRVSAFTESDAELAEAIAELAVVAIENTRLFEELNERATRLERLQKVIATISAKPSDLDKVLYLIVDNLSTIFGNAPCAIRLYDSKTGNFSHRVVITAGVLKERVDYKPRSKGISRYVVEKKVPLYIENTLAKPSKGHPTVRQTIVAQGVRAIANLPLLSEGDVIGVLSLNLTTPHRFSENDKRILELFADQAAVAIKNAQFYERIQEQKDAQIEAVREIARSIAAPMGLQEILEGISDWIVSLMGEANLCEIRLLDEETNELVAAATRGEVVNERFRRIRVEEGITGWVAQHKQSQLVPDVLKDNRYLPALKGARSELAVPMLKEDKLIGILNIEHPQINAFTESDVELAEAIAGLAVVAIDNTHLFEELNERAARLEGLQKVTATISAEPSDLEKSLRLIVSSLSTTFGKALCIIRLYDTKKDKFEPRVAKTFGILKDDVDYTPRSQGTSRYVVKTKTPLYVENTLAKPPEGQPAVRKELVDQGVRATACLPLLSEGKVIGILYLMLMAPQLFSKSDKQILELFANQATVAIKNAQLYERIQRQKEAQIKAVGEIAESIAAPMGLEEILEGILDWTVSLMGEASLASVRFLDKEMNELVVQASRGEKIKQQYYRIPVGAGITGWVAKHKRLQLVPDVLQDNRYLPTIEGTRSELAVPMLKEGELIGILNIEHPEVNAFVRSDIKLAEAIAELVVVAIENTRLYEDLEQKVRQLEDANKRIADTQEILTRTTIAADFVHRLNNLAGTIPIWTKLIQRMLNLNHAKDNQINEYVTQIDIDIQNLLGAVEQLKSLPQPSYLDINVLLDTLIHQVTVQHAEKDKIQVETHLSPDLYSVRAINLHLTSAIWDVISNGIEAMPDRGKLTIIAKNNIDKDDRKWVKIIIEDQGQGISPEDIHNVFKAFYSTKGTGRGYGLWRSKILIEESGGSIKVTSKFGAGSKFTIMLPAATENPKKIK